MKRRHTTVAALLLSLFTVSLYAQSPQQTGFQQPAREKQRLTKELREYREKKDVHGEALTLLQLGLSEASLGNVTGARSNLSEAIDKMRAQHDSIGTWMGLLLLSQFEVAAGRPAEAVRLLERALATLNEAKTSTVPFSLDTLTALGAASGIPPEMRQLLEGPSAGAMKSLMIQVSFEPMTHDLYGSALTDVGQLEKAEAELKTAAGGAIPAQGMFDFSIESHFGDLRYRQQRYDDARTHYVKALSASSKAATMIPISGHQQIQVGIYDRLVRLETATGHPDEAKRWAAKAREASKKPSESR
jgi:tetratricopeptide (TPR) repeat protein